MMKNKTFNEDCSVVIAIFCIFSVLQAWAHALPKFPTEKLSDCVENCCS